MPGETHATQWDTWQNAGSWVPLSFLALPWLNGRILSSGQPGLLKDTDNKAKSVQPKEEYSKWLEQPWEGPCRKWLQHQNQGASHSWWCTAHGVFFSTGVTGSCLCFESIALAAGELRQRWKMIGCACCQSRWKMLGTWPRMLEVDVELEPRCPPEAIC